MRMFGSGGGGGQSCFAGETRITMADGSVKPISDVQVGDKVLGYVFSGELAVQEVTCVDVHDDPEPVFAYSFWGGCLLATRNHWVLTQFNSFAEIGRLAPGDDALVDKAGHLRPMDKVEFARTCKTYNLKVSPDHTFIAEGIRVHNGGLGLGAPIKGAGGGKKSNKGDAAYTPTEASDTLRTKAIARVIDVLSEGPIKGPVGIAKGVHFDANKLQNPDGSYNYPGTKIYFRNGYPTQAPPGGFAEVENEVAVQEEVKSTTNRVAAIYMISQGSGYTYANVTIDPPAGNPGTGTGENPVNTVQATAYAVISGGAITSIVVVNPGANYAQGFPTVTITGDGSGASAWADIAGGVIRRINDPNVDAVRVKVRTGNLLEQTDKGDVIETSIQYTVQFRRNGGFWQNAYTDGSFKPYNNSYSPLTTALRVVLFISVAANSPYDYYLSVRPYGTSTWILAGRYSGFNDFSSPLQMYVTLDALDLNYNYYEWTLSETYGNYASVYAMYYHDINGVMTISGKTTSGYEESIRLALPANGVGAPWDVRVLRYTSDSVSSKKQNALQWSSYSTIIDTKMMYSDTAFVAIEMDSQYFPGGIPRRGYDLEGLIVPVPSNYNADFRTYSGIWDGTFVMKYTNNPVWCFLDILLNDRYGLGQWVDTEYIDYATMYQMAQYCDQLVPNGLGGLEPRFTFNTQILNDEEAYNVLNLMASVFRGMIFWAAGWVSASQDAPTQVQRIVMPANTINGEFTYVGTARKARHSAVLVTWNDPSNLYQRAVEVYEDPDLIQRYGYITKEVTAYGCTSRGQAIRLAKWILDSERHSVDTVTYRAGWDHADARPGEVVAISDPAKSLVRQGGRVISYGTDPYPHVVLDAHYDFNPNQNYQITVVVPTWGKVAVNYGSTIVTGTRTKFTTPLRTLAPGDIIMFGTQKGAYTIQSVNSATQLTLTTPYNGNNIADSEFLIIRMGKLFYASQNLSIDIPLINEGPGTIAHFSAAPPEPITEETPYLITGTDVRPEKYRILSNKEVENGVFEITALQYDETKFDRVEFGIDIQLPPTYLKNDEPLAPPSNIQVNESLYRSNNQVRSRVTVSWLPSSDPRVSLYRIEFRTTTTGWKTAGQITETSFEFIDATPGIYEFRVKALTPIGTPSAGVTKTFQVLGKTAPPGDVTNFVAERTVNGVQLSWDEAVDLDVVGYEIREGNSWASGTIITQQARGTTLFVQLYDAEQHSFHIKAVDELGNYSVNPASLTAAVINPPNVTGFTATPDNDRIIFRWRRVTGQDIKYEIRQGISFGAGQLVGQFDGTDANVMYPVEGEKLFHIKALSSVGLYSIEAASYSLKVTPIQSRNVIFEVDKSLEGWIGAAYNLEPAGAGNSELAIVDGYLSGDFLFEVILTETDPIRARMWFDTELLMDAGSPTWAQAGFTWDSPAADNAWRPLGDLSNARADFFIAINSGVADPLELENWPFNVDLSGLRQNTLPLPGSGLYEQGVGVVTDGHTMLDRQAKLWYEFTVPSQFFIRQSFVFSDIAAEFGAAGSTQFVAELVKLNGAAGRYLKLLYVRSPTPAFVLTDGNTANDLRVEQAGDTSLRVTLGICQTATERRLYLYNHDSMLSDQDVRSITPVGEYNEIEV